MWRLGAAIVWLFHLGMREHDNGSGSLTRARRELLKQAEVMEVYSLEGLEAGPDPIRIQDCPVFGQVVVDNPRVRRQLVSRVLLAYDYPTYPMHCLGAEYGLRAIAGETTIDMVFCFHCSRVYLTGSDGYSEEAAIAPWPKPLMDQLLRDAGVPLPPPHV